MKYDYNWRNQYTLNHRKKLNRRAFVNWDIEHGDLFGFNSEGDSSSDESHTPGDIYTFTMWHYVNFLDRVECLDNLREGLFQLSPFADDALELAESMSDTDFVNFKLALIQERAAARGERENVMPNKYLVLLLPSRFPRAFMLAERARTSLGVALIRCMEVELGI